MSKKDNEALLEAIKELDFNKLPDSKSLVVPMGFPQIDDDIFKRGGLVRGKIYEIAGEPDTWKSVALYKIFANAQKAFSTGICVLVDTEFVVQSQQDLDWIASHGVDLTRLKVIQGNTAEDIFNRMLEMASGDETILVLGLDSLGNMEVANNSSKKRFDDKNKMKDDRVGVFAKVTGSAFKLLANTVAKNDILMVVVNQIRDNLNLYGGGAFTTPGGKAYKHNLSARIEFFKKEVIKKGDEPIGAVIKAVVRRSKISAAGQTGEDNHLQFFNAGQQFAEIYQLYNMAVEAGIIVKAGAWIKSEQLDRKWQGKEKLYAELEESEELRAEMQRLIDEIR